jgi:hypothetical protein
MRVRNLQIAVVSIAIALGWSISSTGASEPHSLAITFIGWTNNLGASAEAQAKFDKVNGPRINLPIGDWAILAITNHGSQFLRFDSIVAEYELSEGRWIEVKPKQWPGLHGGAWMPGTGSISYLLCPREVPRTAQWRVRYLCDVDRHPERSPLDKMRFEVVAPAMMLTPVLPPADSNTSSALQPSK